MPISPTEKAMPSRRRHKRSSGDSRSLRSPAMAESSDLKASLVRISSTETEIPDHRRLNLSSSSKDATADADPDPADTLHREAARAMRNSSTEIEVSGQGRLKRSSSSESASASYPTWVILNRVGVRRDSFDGDGTTSNVSYTSGGDQISVSFVLEKPPQTSLITLDWPQGPSPSEGSTSKPRIVAAHRNVVLLEISRPLRPASIDFFVYKVSEAPSLTRLPVCYWKGHSNADMPRPRIMGKYSTGVLSCGDELFVVADLVRGSPQPSVVDIYLMCSGSNDWKVFKDVSIHNAEGVSHMSWWSTDIVLPWRKHYLIWVDYLRGMIVARITHPGSGTIDPLDPREPVLRYVPLPVDPVQGNPYDNDYGRGCPGATRSVCNTHYGIKFVNISERGNSFSVSLWSFSQKKWREDATMDADQLWELDFENCLPRVQPAFPVVDMEDPNAVCFLLNEGRYTVNPDTPTWMIKIHMTKKLLLESHSYSMKETPSYQKNYTTARRMSEGLSFISSGMPSYLSAPTMERTACHLDGRSSKERGNKLLLEQTCEDRRWCQRLHL